MALNNTILEALNRHINEEFCASYLYLSMSAYCDSMDLPGFAYWMGIQSQEEYAHAMNLFDSVQDRQGWVTLHPIEQPAVDFDSVLGAMETTLGHEREVTKLINQLYELATGKRDYQTQVHLQAFITERIEEEKTASDIMAQLKLIGGNTSDLQKWTRKWLPVSCLPACS